ncbi:hypothetical protein EJB05_01180, partial [Eragrostis curvula]
MAPPPCAIQEPQRFQDPRLPLAIRTGPGGEMQQSSSTRNASILPAYYCLLALIGNLVFFWDSHCNELSKLNHKGTYQVYRATLFTILPAMDPCKLKAEQHNPTLGYGMFLAHVLMFYQGL